MNPEMKIIREVSDQAEEFYADAVRLGDHAAIALKAAHRSQMTSLENIAESTFKTSDIFDYIKKQTARFLYWRQPLPEQKGSSQGFGEQLRNHLETKLLNNLKTVCERLTIGNDTDEQKQERRRIHLLLMRQFIRQMVIEYEFQVSLGSGNSKKKEP
jgi:hypothetical protein